MGRGYWLTLLVGFTIGMGERAYDAFGFEYVRGNHAELAHKKDMRALSALSFFNDDGRGSERLADYDRKNKMISEQMRARGIVGLSSSVSTDQGEFALTVKSFEGGLDRQLELRQGGRVYQVRRFGSMGLLESFGEESIETYRTWGCPNAERNRYSLLVTKSGLDVYRPATMWGFDREKREWHDLGALSPPAEDSRDLAELNVNNLEDTCDI